MLSNYQMLPVVSCDLLAPLPVHQGASGNRCVLEDISRSEEQMLCGNGWDAIKGYFDVLTVLPFLAGTISIHTS